MRSLTAPVLVAALIFSPMAGPALADRLDDAEVAYLRCDYGTAVGLYKALAEEGQPLAQFRLGELYREARGVPRDFAEAMKWFLKAADQGIPAAQYNVGLMYFLAQGVPQDYTEAATWFGRAAEQGHAEAQNTLGIMYLMGEGVPYDYVLAHFWYDLASSHFAEEQKREIAAMNRDRIASGLAPEQLAKARRMAREWRAGRSRAR